MSGLWVIFSYISEEAPSCIAIARLLYCSLVVLGIGGRAKRSHYEII